MKLEKPICPECGSPAIGTLDKVVVTAMFDGDPSQEDVDWSGESDVDWNSQAPVKDGDQETVICDNSHTWLTEIAETE